MTFMIPAGIIAGTQILQGSAESSALKDSARASDMNAAGVRRAGSADEDTLRRQQRHQLGNIRASAAESGFVSNVGSLLDLQTKSAAEMELDALTHRYKTELQAVGYENEARSLRANATAAKRGGYLKAFGTLASSAGGMINQPRMTPPAPVETRTWPKG